MAGIDRLRDAATGDYVEDGLGGTKTTRSAVTAIYHQANTRLGSWLGDPSAGIREIPGKSSERTRRVVEDVWREAMAPLVAAGRVTDPVVVAERDGDEIVFAVSMSDLQTGEQLRFTHDRPEITA